MEKNNDKNLIWRYERKFIVPKAIEDNIYSLIYNHPARFKEIYTQRTINNIYFDTHNYKFYFDK